MAATADLPTPSKSSRESLSQFLARILDQLSISAWLSAAILVFGLLLLSAMYANEGSIRGAIASFSKMGWVPLVLLLGATTIATVATQAFGFGAIRALEGYWGARRPWLIIGDLLASRQLRMRQRLEARLGKVQARGLIEARARMPVKRPDIDTEVADLVIRLARGTKEKVSDELRAKALLVDWRDLAQPRTARSIAALESRINDFPRKDRRILPTRLGNVLRAYEEEAHRGIPGSLESWIISIRSDLPEALGDQHDEHRARLDLYATTAFVLAGLGIAGLGLFWRDPPVAVGVGASAAVATSVSHRALIASARGYGEALKAVGDWDRKRRGLQPS